MIRRLAAALILLALPAAVMAAPQGFDPGRAGFDVEVRGLDIDYAVFALFAIPGETVPVALHGTVQGAALHADAGTVHLLGPGRWTWTAPNRSGHYRLDVTRSDGARMRLETFVMVPASAVRDGLLNGYRIGTYPKPHGAHAAHYRPPAGFVEVTPDLKDVHISPHFTLGEFLCKEVGGYPKYLVLHRRLLLKLEDLMDYLNGHGVDATSVHVMSGYRTPWYNAQLGNVPDSRHTLGDAADIYIDVAPANGIMDDLNHDGHDNEKDARLLAADIDLLFREPQLDFLRGGVGVYGSTRTHGPFVHVDARGWRARW